jgi:protein-disulfide isomerase
MNKLPALLLAAAAAAAAQAPARPAIDKAALEAYLRHLELWIPQVAVTIGDPTPSRTLPGFSEVIVNLSYNGQGKEEHYLVSPDGKSIVKGEAYALDGNPFQANLDRIKLTGQPSFGPATAKVDIVVYGDFQCPYCKAEAETMRANVPKTFAQDVRVFFKDFPLEQIHPWARPASIAGRCVFRQNAEAFWKFHDWIYKVQSEITPENLTERTLAWAGENGVNGVELGRCIETRATDAEVMANLNEGRALGVDATPTLIINGRKLPGGVLEWPVLQGLIQLELAHLNDTASGGGK